MTCLHWAAGRGFTRIAEILLENKAKVDATDKYGSTPLIWAARKGFLSIVQALLEHEANPNAVGMVRQIITSPLCVFCFCCLLHIFFLRC